MKIINNKFIFFVPLFFLINLSIYTNSNTMLKNHKHSYDTTHAKERILKNELLSLNLDKNKEHHGVNFKINSVPDRPSILIADQKNEIENSTGPEKTPRHLKENSNDKTVLNSEHLINPLNVPISALNNSNLLKNSHQLKVTPNSSNMSNNLENITDSNLLQTIRKSETNIKNYFKTTSKNNQYTAWGALSAFVGGFILWYISISLTCWNEKRAVRVAELADHINDESKVEYIEDLQNEKYDSNKAYMVSGKLILNREAQIEGSNLKIKSDFGEILIIKLKIEKFSKSTVIEEKEVIDRYGNNVTELSEKDYKNWVEDEAGDNVPVTKYFYGDSLIAGNYRYDCSKLKIVFNEKQNIAIYEFTDADSSALHDYLRVYFKNSNFFIRSKSLYIITSNPLLQDNEFDQENYNFTNDDYKISLSYYYLPKDVDTYFTAIGSLSPKENGIWEFGPFESNIKNAEFGYLCCFCEDSSNMKIDTVLTERMTKQKYYEHISKENNSIIWFFRVVCFFIHFGSYYLILYPFIMIFGMIPYLGAIGAGFLILVAFLISIITFLIVVAVAWIFARPLRVLIIFALVGILILVTKSYSDQLKAQYNSNDSNSRIFGISSENLKFL